MQGVGEKVWLQYQGVENIFGYVWHFLLQDILQFDMDTDEALSRIATANRTCSIWCVAQQRARRRDGDRAMCCCCLAVSAVAHEPSHARGPMLLYRSAAGCR